ncbi:MAG TPA: class I SAM-dependent methyltransferase [Alphaproteobacteria bacterium]
MSAQALWLERLEEAGNFTRWVGEAIRPHVRGRALEIGCGTGTYTELLAKWCDEVVAIDLDPAFAEAARRRFADEPKVRVMQADARRLPDLGTFDSIVMLDVLEHIEDDVSMLRLLRERLGASGRLVLKVPAMPALYGALDSAIGHHRRYSRRSLARAAAEAGLALTECRAFNLAAAPGWWLNGRILGRTHPPQTQLRLYDRLVPLFRIIDRVSGPPVGTSLIAAAARIEARA